MKVKGDGSCWVYAILAAMYLMENTHMTKELTPTTRDRAMDDTCRSFSMMWLEQFSTHMTVTERSAIEDLQIMPQYDQDKLISMGTFGDSNTLMGLAGCLGISVVMWNKKMLNKRNVKHQVIICMNRDHCDSTNTWPYEMKESAMLIEEIVTFCKDPTHMRRVAHIEWDGSAHYACMQSVNAVDSRMGSVLMQSATPVPTPDPKPVPTPDPKPVAKPVAKPPKPFAKLPTPDAKTPIRKLRKPKAVPMVSVKPKATKSTLPDALVASKNAYKASKLIDTLPTEWGFNMLFPEALPRTKDIASKKNMNNVIFQGCEDLETSHINEAIQNKYNIVALGWTENDSEFDPSYIFHFRSVSSEVYFTHALPKELVSFQVYMDPSLIAYSK